jgi:hypothetical protein
MYSLNRSIDMISLFCGTNQLLLLPVKIPMPILIPRHQALLLLNPFLPMQSKNQLGTHVSMSSSTCLVVFKILLSINHRSPQTTCDAVNAGATIKRGATSENTRSATSGHGNAHTHPATGPFPSPRTWNVTNVPELMEEMARTIIAIPPHAIMAATGRKMGSFVETIVFGTWKPVGNEFKLKDNQNHIDQADQTIHWV